MVRAPSVFQAVTGAIVAVVVVDVSANPAHIKQRELNLGFFLLNIPNLRLKKSS